MQPAILEIAQDYFLADDRSDAMVPRFAVISLSQRWFQSCMQQRQLDIVSVPDLGSVFGGLTGIHAMAVQLQPSKMMWPIEAHT